jgi:hypothetical protein
VHSPGKRRRPRESRSTPSIAPYQPQHLPGSRATTPSVVSRQGPMAKRFELTRSHLLLACDLRFRGSALSSRRFPILGNARRKSGVRRWRSERCTKSPFVDAELRVQSAHAVPSAIWQRQNASLWRLHGSTSIIRQAHTSYISSCKTICLLPESAHVRRRRTPPICRHNNDRLLNSDAHPSDPNPPPSEWR